MTNLIPHALGYLNKSISIIPVGKDKIPLINWKPYQERMATEQEARQWWTQYPTAQIGIVTGKLSNLLVIDVEKGGDSSWLPQNTAIIQTGGGGKHYYYSFVDGVKNKARIKDLVDIRGEGGYVVAPPSETDKGKYVILQKRRLMPFPKNLFSPGQPKTQQEYKQEISTTYDGANEGQRNATMTSYVGHLLTKIHPTEWNTIAWEWIKQANHKNNPPLYERELKTIFDSIKNLEKKNDTERWYQREKNNPNDLWDDEENSEVMQMGEVAKQIQLTTGEVYPLGIKLFDDAIKGGVTSGNLVVISAPTRMGKTSLSQNFTYNLAGNMTFPLPCLWFSYEMMVDELWEKFKQMGVGDDWIIFSPRKITSGDTGWIRKKIQEAKKKYFTNMIFIDHLGFLLPDVKKKDFNDYSRNYSAYLGGISRDLKRMALDEQVVIFLVAHMRKTNDPSLDDIRDSSGIAQEADFVFTLEREFNPDKESLNYFTNYTKIALEKNRKTGQSVKGWFEMIDGKFEFNPHYKSARLSFNV